MANIELMLKRRSITQQQVTDAVAQSVTISEVLRLLGQHPSGGNYRWINMMIDILELDTSHHTGQAHLLGKSHDWTKEIPLADVLVEDSTYIASTSLKRKLFKYEMLARVCAKCEQDELWCDNPLTLQLDHINGNPRDNRIENLRLLCPNCHSQTKTWAGRNQQRYK